MPTKRFKMNGKNLASSNDIRIGWAKSFEDMHKAGDDKLLIPDVFEDETIEYWKFNEVKKLSNKLL